MLSEPWFSTYSKSSYTARLTGVSPPDGAVARNSTVPPPMRNAEMLLLAALTANSSDPPGAMATAPSLERPPPDPIPWVGIANFKASEPSSP